MVRVFLKAAAVGCTGPFPGYHDVVTQMTTVRATVGREERSFVGIGGIA